MAPTNNTNDLCAALERLTGARPDQGPHKKLYALTVIASDGVEANVIAGVTYHRKGDKPARGNLAEIADAWRIERKDLREVLETWTHEQLVAWLQRFTSEQLLPPYLRRQRGIT